MPTQGQARPTVAAETAVVWAVYVNAGCSSQISHVMRTVVVPVRLALGSHSSDHGQETVGLNIVGMQHMRGGGRSAAGLSMMDDEFAGKCVSGVGADLRAAWRIRSGLILT